MGNKKYSNEYEDFNISEVLEKILKRRRGKKEVKSIWGEKKKK